MIELPEILTSRYDPASSHDVRSWSFGCVDRVRNRVAESWTGRVRTLDDESIFGPLRDHECACGKYQMPKYCGMICDRCGVKVMRADEARRTRCGHIELSLSVLHPTGRTSEPLEAVPILPATVWRSPAGRPLADLYEDIVRANRHQDMDVVSSILERIIQTLAPIAEAACSWDLESTATLARGLLLTPRSDTCKTL
jgi:hypothetical protein